MKVRTTTWIRFKIEDKDRNVIEEVGNTFNSRMTEIYWGSDMDEMFTHMKTQVEYSALANGRFVFDQVLFLDINFHKLKLTRGSSYIPFPDWIAKKNVVINPQNEEDEECFK